MLRDGWRFMRDFLYVDNQHGAPWDDVWLWYSDWLPDVRHRSDFTRLLDMLSGEIAVGHSYVSGGDMPSLTSPRTGLLGIDLAQDASGFYRIVAYLCWRYMDAGCHRASCRAGHGRRGGRLPGGH